jgi:hypothetical protein
MGKKTGTNLYGAGSAPGDYGSKNRPGGVLRKKAIDKGRRAASVYLDGLGSLDEEIKLSCETVAAVLGYTADDVPELVKRGILPKRQYFSPREARGIAELYFECQKEEGFDYEGYILEIERRFRSHGNGPRGHPAKGRSGEGAPDVVQSGSG